MSPPRQHLYKNIHLGKTLPLYKKQLTLTYICKNQLFYASIMYDRQIKLRRPSIISNLDIKFMIALIISQMI